MKRLLKEIEDLSRDYSSLVKIILTFTSVFLVIPFFILLYNRGANDWLTAFMTFYLVIATLGLAIITAAVIIWQGQQLKRQLELQVITELYKEWNEDEMFEARCSLCKILPPEGIITDFGDDTFDKVENVIEFLERIASYYMNSVLTKRLVWDTFSFYIMRYYFYTQKAIKEIEKYWGDDKILYRDLSDLYNELIDYECNERNKNKKEIEQSFVDETNKFKKSECYEIQISQNSD
ncbi:MAG: hypothetical protein ABSC45_07075 [Desulfobaccales bacterium]|jgi:hypothetical protein